MIFVNIFFWCQHYFHRLVFPSNKGLHAFLFSRRARERLCCSLTGARKSRVCHSRIKCIILQQNIILRVQYKCRLLSNGEGNNTRLFHSSYVNTSFDIWKLKSRVFIVSHNFYYFFFIMSQNYLRQLVLFQIQTKTIKSALFETDRDGRLKTC